MDLREQTLVACVAATVAAQEGAGIDTILAIAPFFPKDVPLQNSVVTSEIHFVPIPAIGSGRQEYKHGNARTSKSGTSKSGVQNPLSSARERTQHE